MDYTINYNGQDVIMGNIADSHATRERNVDFYVAKTNVSNN